LLTPLSDSGEETEGLVRWPAASDETKLDRLARLDLCFVSGNRLIGSVAGVDMDTDWLEPFRCLLDDKLLLIAPPEFNFPLWSSLDDAREC
jgi:hypothetical protein